jgi:tRNA (guanine37-N1)-methyltransferase
MRFSLLSLFPDYFRGPLDVSILKRARERGLIEIELIDIRDFSEERHAKVDDRPFGGGPGMVMAPGPVVRAIRSVRHKGSRVIHLSPQGKPLSAALAAALAKEAHLVLLSGHYEGIDERALELEVDEEISIGDYVLTSGCVASIVLLDAVSRFVPGVIGHPEGPMQDSFQNGLFDGPHYTRPLEFEGLQVPEVLRQGNHADIARFRAEKAYEKTKRVRPDLLKEKIP